MLQNLNRCLLAAGYKRVLSVPSNFEILTNLRNQQKNVHEAHQNNQRQKDQSVLMKQSEEKKRNQQKEVPVIYERKSEQKEHQNKENSEESQVYYNVSSLRQQVQFPVHQEEQHLSAPQQQQQEQQEYAKLDFSASSLRPQQKQQPSASELHKPAHDEKFSKLGGWFFVDQSEEISSAHSLQNNVS